MYFHTNEHKGGESMDCLHQESVLVFWSSNLSITSRSSSVPPTALILILRVFQKFQWSGLILIVEIIEPFPDFIAIFFTWWQHFYSKSVGFGQIGMNIHWTYSTRFHIVSIFIICEEIISKVRWMYHQVAQN